LANVFKLQSIFSPNPLGNFELAAGLSRSLAPILQNLHRHYCLHTLIKKHSVNNSIPPNTSRNFQHSLQLVALISTDHEPLKKLITMRCIIAFVYLLGKYSSCRTGNCKISMFHIPSFHPACMCLV